MEDNHIYKSHNKTLLLYDIVFPIKYRSTVISEEGGERLKQICIEISERYEIHFVEIGYEGDHVHFLIQGVPKLSVSKIVGSVKSNYGERDLSAAPDGQGAIVGREFLDEWVLCKYGWSIRKPGSCSKIY